ncbi:enolase C-terminal domain-like protein [Virgisporangium ochraceum]|nr:enolase C-terminal domain-like protein [Virgisporangium ochraceum]
MALWDIAGKRAGMPVHDLLGGLQRTAARCCTHAAGATVDASIDHAADLMERGYGHVRLQTGQPGLGAYGFPGTPGGYPGHPNPDGWDVHHYLRTAPALFAAARERLGADVELLHDVHSRLTGKQAVVLARSLEPYRLFFLEDPVAPEHYDRLPEVRAAAPVPIAAGEQVASVADAARLVQGGGVDLLRLHVSAVGGVQTAWHGPADVSPVGCVTDTCTRTPARAGASTSTSGPRPGSLRCRDCTSAGRCTSAAPTAASNPRERPPSPRGQPAAA